MSSTGIFGFARAREGIFIYSLYFSNPSLFLYVFSVALLHGITIWIFSNFAISSALHQRFPI